MLSRTAPISIVEVTNLASSHKTFVKMDKISCVVTRLLITCIDHVWHLSFPNTLLALLMLYFYFSHFTMAPCVLFFVLYSLCSCFCCFLHTLFLHFVPTLVNHTLFQLITLSYSPLGNYSMIIWALFLLLMIYSFCWYFAPFWHYAN